MKTKDSTEGGVSSSLRFLFAVYLIILTWGILFKFKLDVGQLVKSAADRRLVIRPYNGNIKYAYKEDVVLNLIAFVPFGIYISAAAKKQNVFVRILLTALTSFFYEAMQYVFAIGCADVTDLIDNTLGGIIGMILYYIASKILRKHTDKVLVYAARIVTFVTIILLSLGVITNFRLFR